MQSRASRGSLLVVALAYLAAVGGCGAAETGNQVQFDKGKDEKLQKSMGDYMNKQSEAKQPK